MAKFESVPIELRDMLKNVFKRKKRDNDDVYNLEPTPPREELGDYSLKRLFNYLDIDLPRRSELIEFVTDRNDLSQQEISNRVEILREYMNFSILANRYVINRETQEEDELRRYLYQSGENLRELLLDQKYILFYPETNVYYTLSAGKISDLLAEIEQQDAFGSSEFATSDSVIIFKNFMFNEDMIGKFYIMTPRIAVRNTSGQLFIYRHNTKLDLTSLQILHMNDSEEKYYEVNSEHCFINSIKLTVEKSEKLDNYLNILRSRIGYKKFKSAKISEILPDWLEIKLTKYDENMKVKDKLKTIKCQGKSNITHTAKIFLYREHYMPDIKIKNEKRNFVSSTAILRSLHNKNNLFPCKMLFTRDKDVSEDILEKINILDEQEEYKLPKIKSTKNLEFHYADFEAIVYGVKKHLPFMIGCVNEHNEYKCINAESKQDLDESKIFVKLLEHIIRENDKRRALDDNYKKDKFLLYFHNLKYDLTFIRTNKYITITNELERKGTYYGFEFIYQKRTFVLRDSFKLISSPLEKFKSMFNLESGKQKFDLYNIIDLENFNKPYILFDDLKKMISEREEKKFRNYDFSKYIVDDKYYHLDHYKEYLKHDCITLKQGLDKFSEIIEKLTGLNIKNFLTISSIGFYHLQKQGGLDGVFKIKGNLLQYIMGAVCGGRVCMQKNKKQMILKKRIQDFDGCSLYPSAMVRPDLIIPCGKCEYFKNKTLKEINEDYSQYVMTYRVRIKKKQQIPMISVKNKKGIREWLPEVNENEWIRTDKVTLEDLINFCDAEVLEIKHGVGWPKINGINTTIKDIIKPLYDLRLNAKKEKNNALSESLKLLLNSIYGKSLLKECQSATVYIRGRDKLDKYISNNYHAIKEIKLIDDVPNEHARYRVKYTKQISNHFNFGHIGCFILSISKRIMNEIFAIANDNNIKIFYTDTDSMFLEEHNLPILAELFKQKYNRTLIGNYLGQFHSDLSSQKIKGELHATDLICIGKKCYLARLENDKGEFDYHVRFKGANEKNIDEFCKENNINMMDFYTKLHNGEEVILDICKGKTRFAFTHNSVYKRNSFIRKYKF